MKKVFRMLVLAAVCVGAWSVNDAAAGPKPGSDPRPPALGAALRPSRRGWEVFPSGAPPNSGPGQRASLAPRGPGKWDSLMPSVKKGGGDSSLLKRLGTPPPFPEVSWARGGRDPESRVPPGLGFEVGREARSRVSSSAAGGIPSIWFRLVPSPAWSRRAGRGSLLVSGGGGMVPIA